MRKWLCINNIARCFTLSNPIVFTLSLNIWGAYSALKKVKTDWNHRTRWKTKRVFYPYTMRVHMTYRSFFKWLFRIFNSTKKYNISVEARKNTYILTASWMPSGHFSDKLLIRSSSHFMPSWTVEVTCKN